MKAILYLFIFFASNSFANDYVAYIYDGYNTEETEENDPTKGIIPWMDLSYIDMSKIKPGVTDAASATIAYYRLNLGQRDFVGNTYGFTPFQKNYNSNKLIGCVSYSDDYCANNNLKSIYYDETKSSGKYYFEVEQKGSPYTDIVGVTHPNHSHIASQSQIIGAGYTGYKVMGLKWLDRESGKSDITYKLSSTQPSGTVYGIWIDYDNKKMAVMELTDGTDITDYKNYMDYTE